MKIIVFCLVFFVSMNVKAMMSEESSSTKDTACPQSTSAMSDLFHSICHGDEAEFFLALEQFKTSGQNPNEVVDRFGLSPLHWAASLWNLKWVEALVNAGFSPHQSGGTKGNTPLFSAIKGNHFSKQDQNLQLPVIQYFVKQESVNLDFVNQDGITAMGLAESLNLSEIATYLNTQSKAQ